MSLTRSRPDTGSSTGNETHDFAYQPALDGIRALAVIAVLLYHGDQRYARAGFLGVDVFFVLSGFLITMLLLRELRSTGHVDLRSFYARRARRLLPAVLALLAVLSLYAFLFASAADRTRIRSDGLASLFYVQNWHLVLTGQSYFDQFTTPSPLRHMWSLAIEEQWYLLWPVLLVGLTALARKRAARVFVLTCALAAASAIAMAALYRSGADPSRVYYGTDTRAQELLVGALLAMAWPLVTRLRTRGARAGLQVAGAAGGLFVVVMIHRSSDASTGLYRGGLTLVALASAAVIAAAMSGGPARSVLSTRPLPAIGRISYGIYLWHWPLFLWLTPKRVGFGGLGLFAVRVAVTLVVAGVSFRFVEQPIRTRRHPLVRRPLVWVPATAAVVGVCLVLGGSSWGLGKTGTTLNGGAIAKYAAAVGALNRPPKKESVRVFLAGDSVAFFFSYYGLPAESRDNFAISGRPIIGCGIATADIVSDGVTHKQGAECDDWPQDYRDAMTRTDPDVTVLLVGAWEVYDRKVDGMVARAGTPALEAYLRAQLDRAAGILTSNGAPLVLLSTPCFRLEPGGVAKWGIAERNSATRIAWFNDVLRRYAAAHPGRTTFLDLHGVMCPGDRYRNEINGVKTRADGMHFTPEGAHLAWRWLLPQLQPLALAGEPYRRRQEAPPASSTTVPPNR
jgi:peptidoglycan/LPS O-acetylase OafA/YrhL